MEARRQRPGWGGCGVAYLLLLACPALASPLSPGQVLPLAVHDGRCEFTLPTERLDDKFYLILGSLSRGAGPYPVIVRTDAAAGPSVVPLDTPRPDSAWARQAHDCRDRLARVSQSNAEANAYPPAAQPARQRVFYLFTRENDFQNQAGYTTIQGELRAVGTHCQVYVDRDHADPAGLQPTVQDVVRTFDDEVYPRAVLALGQALDVDRDGRFTILFTGWLGKMSNGKVSLGGFVRGSDFYRDLPGPFSNRCDMMYLNTDLKPGPHLRSLLAHEYTHAIVFSEHVFGSYQPGVPRQDEEGWLNEALAHLAEDLHGYGRSNLDYRISAFLSAPERYQLVVPDYYAAGLWRSHGHRGATYLFLRWCVDRHGDDLLARLIQTNLNGTANVEDAVRERFAPLFRQWCVALALTGSNLAGDHTPLLQRIDLHRPVGGRLLCGPRFDEVPLTSGRHEVKLAGTATSFLLLHSPRAGHARVTVTAAPDANLQVTLLRLPPQSGRLSVSVVSPPSGKDPVQVVAAREPPGRSLRLALAAHDDDLVLDGAAWERLVPTANRLEDSSFSPGQASDEQSTSWFGDPRLRAGQTRLSRAISLPEASGPNDAVVFKVSATDRAGHRLSAWAVVKLAAE